MPSLLVLALAASTASAWLVISGRPVAGGAVAAGAVGASILAGLAARSSGAALLVFADHAVERVLEALLFGSIAWAAIPAEPWTAAAAVTALVASYLASYMATKAIGLGFEIRERVPYRSVRPLMAVLGLVIPAILDIALWAAAVISLEPVVRHGASVARQREPA
ncbi:MAG: hypothetical protein ACRDH9_11445 [Actinomycetota bacterium]